MPSKTDAIASGSTRRSLQPPLTYTIPIAIVQDPSNRLRAAECPKAYPISSSYRNFHFSGFLRGLQVVARLGRWQCRCYAQEDHDGDMFGGLASQRVPPQKDHPQLDDHLGSPYRFGMPGSYPNQRALFKNCRMRGKSAVQNSNKKRAWLTKPRPYI